MPVPSEQNLTSIPESSRMPWSIAYQVSWASLKRRILRAMITMVGVILAIAFLANMLITDSINKALVAANVDQLNIRLQRAGVDILATSAGEVDRQMVLLISLSLMICLVGIINAMLMSVTERVKEIGTLKCLGATDDFIVRSYFIEASLQGVIGTSLGMILGFIVAVAIAYLNFGNYVFSYFPVFSSIKALSGTFVTGSLISIFAAIGPAYSAARKQPVEALRVEE